ncbi:MAG: caspase family protein [Acidobacteriota bacterium]
MIEGTRRAMIVGINQYKDERIPPLKGAENDAQDLYERLTDPNIGNFEILDNHFLLGEQATVERIRKAISDLFWETDHADLTLFYFSGHGFVDGYDDGYMAPYDFCEDEPFVCGANMREFKHMLSRSQSASVVVILDCCFSGITTRDDRALRTTGPADRAKYEANLKDLSGEGRIIFASSTPDQVSREKNFTLKDGKRRQRGMFTHYLLNGLDGAASDEQGIISIPTLQGYIEKKFTGKKQTPRFFTEGSNLSSIKLAIATETYDDYVGAKITKAKDFIDDKSFASLLGARICVLEVLDLNAGHKEALELKDIIAKSLDEQKDLTSHWVTTNALDIRHPLKHIFLDFDGLIDRSNFDAISSLSKKQLDLLNLLHRASMGELNLTQFIQRCGPFNKPASSSQPTSGPPT